MSQTIIFNILKYIQGILRNQGKVNFSNIYKNLSHDSLTRIMSGNYMWQQLYLKFICSLVKLNNAYLIIDDTIIEKPHSSLSQYVRWVYSNKENKVVKGIQIVFILLIVDDLRIPIDFRIYDKARTKINLALDLLSYCRNTLKLKKMMVLFDSWYSARIVLKRIKDYGWNYVCRIRKNRKVNKKKVKELFLSPYGMMRGELSKMKVILVRHGKYYLLTNNLSLSKLEIRNWYSKRSQIEEFFKVLKKQFHIKDCQSRVIESWKNHIFLVLLSFVFVELKSKQLGITVYKVTTIHRLKDYRPYIQRWNTIMKNA